MITYLKVQICEAQMQIYDMCKIFQVMFHVSNAHIHYLNQIIFKKPHAL